MTVSERYHSPCPFRGNRKTGVCACVKKRIGDWQYDDADLEQLNTIMTLYHIGLTVEEMNACMCLLPERDLTAV